MNSNPALPASPPPVAWLSINVLWRTFLLGSGWCAMFSADPHSRGLNERRA